jgi:hypothetical protein
VNWSGRPSSPVRCSDTPCCRPRERLRRALCFRHPIILFNARYEFLVGAADPPAPWEILEGQSFLGKPYSRRSAENHQNFAVKVGAAYAGSASSLALMNSKSRMRISPDFHVVLILHEMFHAYQADRDWARFYELAASRADRTASIKFDLRLPFFLQWDFVRLEKQLGAQEGDLRAAWPRPGFSIA